MPEISLFYGIRVTMYYNDHMPPHFHAEYNGHKALVDINNIQVIRGSFPPPYKGKQNCSSALTMKKQPN